MSKRHWLFVIALAATQPSMAFELTGPMAHATAGFTRAETYHSSTAPARTLNKFQTCREYWSI